MKYGDIAAIFLAPLVDTIDAPDVTATPARRLRDALEPIATQGWWSPQAGARLDALGVDFLPGYVWGRAAALGSPTASVVAATFGVFEPGLIAAVYEAGSALVPRDDILAAREDGGTASVAAIADPDDCAAVADPLLAVLADLDGLGRPLFSALRALPVPTSPAGRLSARRGTRSGTSRRRPPRGSRRGRPHRGRGERAHGTVARLRPRRVQRHPWVGPPQLGAAVANLQVRGWMDGDDLTDRGRAAHVRIEEVTDASQESPDRGVRGRTRRHHRQGGGHLDPVGRGPGLSCGPTQARRRLAHTGHQTGPLTRHTLPPTWRGGATHVTCGGRDSEAEWWGSIGSLPRDRSSGMSTSNPQFAASVPRPQSPPDRGLAPPHEQPRQSRPIR